MRRWLAILLLVPAFGSAADLRSVTVDKIDDTYVMRSEVFFDAGIEHMYAVLLDWDLSTEFSSVVVESRNLAPDDRGRPRYYTRNEACVAFFCKSFEREGVIEHEPYKFIEAAVYPDKSDFHFSNERWTFREEGAGTVVIYDIEFSPKFFVPPLIGPYMIKRKLKSGSGDAIDRIEAIAQEFQAGVR